jgi:molybdopterin-guanine dinucleotide biosynthesis protein A
MNNIPPVNGLLLAGGASQRMQRDKAALLYCGRTQLERSFDLLSRHVGQAYLSVRREQTDEPTRRGRPQIIDSVEGGGPIVGIRSAFTLRNDCAWLVIACDLPFLTDDTLEFLLRHRDPAAPAIAYRSSHDGLPEPLCAIYEPRCGGLLEAYAAAGGHCPRKFLINNNARLLQPVDARALDNINTPQEYAAALEALGSQRHANAH